MTMEKSVEFSSSSGNDGLPMKKVQAVCIFRESTGNQSARAQIAKAIKQGFNSNHGNFPDWVIMSKYKFNSEIAIDFLYIVDIVKTLSVGESYTIVVANTELSIYNGECNELISSTKFSEIFDDPCEAVEETIDIQSRFLVFMISTYEPDGGIRDVGFSFNTFEDFETKYFKDWADSRDYDRLQIFDCLTKKVYYPDRENLFSTAWRLAGNL